MEWDMQRHFQDLVGAGDRNSPILPLSVNCVLSWFFLEEIVERFSIVIIFLLKDWLTAIKAREPCNFTNSLNEKSGHMPYPDILVWSVKLPNSYATNKDRFLNRVQLVWIQNLFLKLIAVLRLKSPFYSTVNSLVVNTNGLSWNSYTLCQFFFQLQ